MARKWLRILLILGLTSLLTQCTDVNEEEEDSSLTLESWVSAIHDTKQPTISHRISEEGSNNAHQIEGEGDENETESADQEGSASLIESGVDKNENPDERGSVGVSPVEEKEKEEENIKEVDNKSDDKSADKSHAEADLKGETNLKDAESARPQRNGNEDDTSSDLPSSESSSPEVRDPTRTEEKASVDTDRDAKSMPKDREQVVTSKSTLESTARMLQVPDGPSSSSTSPPSDLSVSWRLTDNNLVDDITNKILASGETGVVPNPNRSGELAEVSKPKFNEAASKVVETRVLPPGHLNNASRGHICQAKDSWECLSPKERIQLRQKLLKELETSYNIPLPSRIRYRLKKKPSVYTSKKPNIRYDIGIPDIYETEVQVTPKYRKNRPGSRSTVGYPKEDYRVAADRSRHQYLPTPPGPSYVPIEALITTAHPSFAGVSVTKPYIPLNRHPESEQSSGLVFRPPRRPPGINRRRTDGLLRRPTPGKPHFFTPKPDRVNLQAHLQYRRPVSFKFKRTGDEEHYPNESPDDPTTRVYTTVPYPVITSVGTTKYLPPKTSSTSAHSPEPSLKYSPPTKEYVAPKDPHIVTTTPHHGTIPQKYLPPDKEYGPPHSTHPAVSSTVYTEPPEKYVPPNKEYVPPHKELKPHVTHHGAPTEVYHPPSEEHALHKTSHKPVSSPYTNPPRKYIPPDKEYLPPPKEKAPSKSPGHPSDEYIAPKSPDLSHSVKHQESPKAYDEPPRKYLPPNKDYSPPQEYVAPKPPDHHPPVHPKSSTKKYDEPPRKYLPPNREYVAPPSRPKPHESGFTPPPRNYLPPNKSYSAPHRVRGKGRPHLRRRLRKRKKGAKHTTPTPPSQTYLLPHKDEENKSSDIRKPPTDYKLPERTYIPPNKEYIPPSHADHPNVPQVTTVSSIFYTAPARTYLPPIRDYKATPTKPSLPNPSYNHNPSEEYGSNTSPHHLEATKEYVPPLPPTPTAKDYGITLKPHYGPPSQTYELPSRDYLAPPHKSEPHDAALPSWLMDLQGKTPTPIVQKTVTYTTNPTPPPGYHPNHSTRGEHFPITKSTQENPHKPSQSGYEYSEPSTPSYHPKDHAHPSPKPGYHAPEPTYKPPHNGYQLPPHSPPHASPHAPEVTTASIKYENDATKKQPTHSGYHIPKQTYIPPNIEFQPPDHYYSPKPLHYGHGMPHLSPKPEHYTPDHLHTLPKDDHPNHPVLDRHYVPPKHDYHPPDYGHSTPVPDHHPSVYPYPPTKAHVTTYKTPIPGKHGPSVEPYLPPKGDHPILPHLEHKPTHSGHQPEYKPPAHEPHVPQEIYKPPVADHHLIPGAHSPKATYKPKIHAVTTISSAYAPPLRTYVPPSKEHHPPKNDYHHTTPMYVPPKPPIKTYHSTTSSPIIPEKHLAPDVKDSVPKAYLPPPPPPLHIPIDLTYLPPVTKPSSKYIPPIQEFLPPGLPSSLHAPIPNHPDVKGPAAPPSIPYHPTARPAIHIEHKHTPAVHVETEYTPPVTPKPHLTSTAHVELPAKHPKPEYGKPPPPKEQYIPPQQPVTHLPSKEPHYHPHTAHQLPQVTTYKPNYDSKVQKLQEFSYPGTVKLPQPTLRPHVIENSPTTYSPPVYTPTTYGPGFNDLPKSVKPAIVPTNPPHLPQHISDLYSDYDYYYDYYDDDDYYYYYDYDDDDYYYYYYDDYDYGLPEQRPPVPHHLIPNSDYDILDNEIYDFGYIAGIPGRAGRDYPILSYIPLTSFGCDLVADYPGYYADMEAGCQVFHICHRNGRQDSFLCPNGTIFNQKYFVCDWWYNFACEDAPFFYPVNAAIGHPNVPLHRNAFETNLEEARHLPPLNSPGLVRQQLLDHATPVPFMDHHHPTPAPHHLPQHALNLAPHQLPPHALTLAPHHLPPHALTLAPHHL